MIDRGFGRLDARVWWLICVVAPVTAKATRRHALRSGGVGDVGRNHTDFRWVVLVGTLSWMLALDALAMSSREEQLAARRELVAIGVDFTASSLVNAIERNDPLVVDLLMEGGIDVNLRSEDGRLGSGRSRRSRRCRTGDTAVRGRRGRKRSGPRERNDGSPSLSRARSNGRRGPSAGLGRRRLRRQIRFHGAALCREWGTFRCR